MSDTDHVVYPPLNTLKPVAQDIWIVDGPAIRFGPPMLKMSFPTRMTVIRLAGNALFVHSPTTLAPQLKTEMDGLGNPAWIVGPNRIHYWWIPEWRNTYPGAAVFLAPRIREQAGDHIDFPTDELKGATGHPWDDAIATLPVAGSYMTEFVFFHRASRTLVLTDLIENFEPERLGYGARWLAWAGGVLDPDGQMPRDMRLTFSRQREELRQAVGTMIGWQPDRVILAHGRWYERDAVEELRRAFRWLMD
ncbi:hypothetical protein MesoLjLc_58460 [Mesorhizobium sp. L-8-10]|uniref:DUF4336 domain-containing protein n=1 Tax=Mesorhizobium sp. L-8-10 TaxID=2744523 RepID=UPI001927344B|nr:DUF4336 domain-containing protein [Mesorhizobium sp. L-8-10]BCH33916.1 hypothetical protein MesoLjLc_58460 [Mesorhizobium sp. L-8-10]